MTSKKQVIRIVHDVELDLNHLANINGEIQTINDAVLELIDDALIQSGLMVKYKDQMERIKTRTRMKDTIEARIKTSVGDLGESVRANSLQAVFCGGRTSWDNDKMTGYAAAHPEINEFKSVGSPSVSIRQVKH